MLGRKIFRIFPKAREWSAKGSIRVFDEQIEPATLRDLLVLYGSYVGYGPLRPSRGWPHGRFEVIKFTVPERK
jgi:hypothetical protein